MRQGILLGGVAISTAVILIVVVLGLKSLVPVAATTSPSSAVFVPSDSPDPSALAVAGASATPAVSPGVDATPSPDPTADAPTATPTATPGATPTKGATGTPKPTARPTPTPAPTARPTTHPTPHPTPTPMTPGTVMDVTINGKDYAAVSAGPDLVLTTPGNSVVATTHSGGSVTSRLTYQIPSGALPHGTTLSRIDAKICGSAGGDFWEVYGPVGADPFELEVTQPDGDGCWHFTGGSGKSSSLDFFVYGDSHARIDKVVYTVTAG